MKTARLCRINFEVPDWVTHIANDLDGEVVVFDSKPSYHGGAFGLWCVEGYGGKHRTVGKLLCPCEPHVIEVLNGKA